MRDTAAGSLAGVRLAAPELGSGTRTVAPPAQPWAGCYTSGLSPHLARAGQWFLRSGIQEPNGGVARYYRTDLQSNYPVSTEITGYSVSALVYLHTLTRDERWLQAALRAARFLTRQAWDAESRSMPFEVDPPASACFFDSRHRRPRAALGMARHRRAGVPGRRGIAGRIHGRRFRVRRRQLRTPSSRCPERSPRRATPSAGPLRPAATN